MLRLPGLRAASRCISRCRARSAPESAAARSRCRSCAHRDRPERRRRSSARTGRTTSAASLGERLMAEAATVDAPYARLEPLEAGIARVLAHNPSAFTYFGTQTYLLGERQLAVVDPGPDLP